MPELLRVIIVLRIAHSAARSPSRPGAKLCWAMASPSTTSGETRPVWRRAPLCAAYPANHCPVKTLITIELVAIFGWQMKILLECSTRTVCGSGL